MNSREHTHNILLGEEFDHQGIPEITESNYGDYPNFHSPKNFSRSAPLVVGTNGEKLKGLFLKLSTKSKILFNFEENKIDLF